MAEDPLPRRYQPEELLYLAGSPLVKKPSGLPPIEEWIGPPPSKPTASRARTDGDVVNGNANDETPRRSVVSPSSSTANRRPSFFESRLSRSSISEDIILGPPKMSFASSSARTASGNDTLRASGLTTPAYDDERGDTLRFERFKGFGGFSRGEDKSKESKGSRDFSDLRSFSKRREDSDGEGWTHVPRPRKSFGAEDGEQHERSRKDLRGEGDKKGTTPWDRDRPVKYENFGKEREREARPRGKRDESSWLLDDRGDRNRDNHREHNRFGGRAEKDPEWLDSDGKAGDSKTAHSMEDFQKWKERMKASSMPAETQKKADDPSSNVSPDIEQRLEKKQEDGLKEDTDGGISLGRAAQQDAPQAADNGVDRFFGFWSGNGILKSPEQGDILSPPPRSEAKIASKSRFTSFFGPQDAQSPPPTTQHREPHLPVNKTPPYAQSPVHDASNEDREGFQRILKMLGSTNLGTSEPNPISPMLSRPSQPSVSPATSGFSAHQPPPQPQQTHHGSTSAARDPNTDFLMRLMGGGQPQQQQRQSHGPPPPPKYGGSTQMPPPPPIDTSILPYGRGINNHPLSSGLDDPAVTMFRQRPGQETSPVLSRGPTMMDHHGPPPGWNPQQGLQGAVPPSLRQVAPPPGFARGQQGPPPPPSFMSPTGVNAPPLPLQLLGGLSSHNGPNGPLPPNMPPPPHMFMPGMNGLNGGPPGPPPGTNMNGPPPHGSFPMPFPPHHHPEGMMSMHAPPPFGFPHHDGLKNPPFSHGPQGKGVLR